MPLSSAWTRRNPVNKQLLKVSLHLRMSVPQGTLRGDKSHGLHPIHLPLTDSLSSASCSCTTGRCVPCLMPTSSAPSTCWRLHTLRSACSCPSDHIPQPVCQTEPNYHRKGAEANSGCRMLHSI